MKHMVIAALALICAGPVAAQGADALRAQLSGQVMTLRGYDNAQRPTGETVHLRLFDTGAARIRFNAFEGDDQQEGWALWRVNPQGQFCTTFATPNGQGVLRATEAEDCLDIAVRGNTVGLNFYGSTGNLDRYSGRLRPM
ncbi:hypothetical protein A8B78_05800 [Jannaschia sp. EhC01]|nr:hypothetical protein A8B78_05800 [Jannaschia sp. EhC01]